tara:strand:- start:49 stop:690 length:642 start_codon:yes stop_codon:yes gene_type:complete
METVQFNIFKPFGPPVAEVKIPEKILDELNNYVDRIIIDKEKSKNLDWGKKLVGDVTQEFKLELDFATKIGWLDFLAKCTAKYVEMATKQQVKQFVLLESWIVRQFENEYNPVHLHGGHISGAGFLKLPKSFGNFTQKNEKKEKLYQGGTLNLVHGQRSFLSESIFTIIPKVGNFYLFPHYLMHTVYPFKGTSEERRSISFNAMVDESLFNNL